MPMAPESLDALTTDGEALEGIYTHCETFVSLNTSSHG
jgi:hypothetical protein